MAEGRERAHWTKLLSMAGASAAGRNAAVEVAQHGILHPAPMGKQL
jgi:hypothetical protein